MKIRHSVIYLLLLITILISSVFHVSANFQTVENSTEISVTADEKNSKQMLSDGVFSYYIYNNSAIIEKCSDTTSSIIIIPDRIGKYKVSKIKDGTFSLCPNLKGFISQNDRFKVINGILYSNDTLLCYPPAKSQKIFLIPSTIKKIAGCAFFGNKSLEYISIPGTIETISNEAFADCQSLKTAILHEGTEKISDAAFTFCSSLENITIPESLNDIGDASFYGCSSLKKINIGDNIENIGKMALQNCSSLTSIYIPKNISNITDWIFTIGKSLKNIKISPENPEYTEKHGMIYTKDGETLIFCPQNAEINNFTVPEGIKTIGSNAFAENQNIESITLSDSVLKIEPQAFYQAKKLKQLNINNNLTEIGEYAFYGCENLRQTTLFTTVEKIGNCAFENCVNLTLLAAKGSPAYFYSQKNNVKFQIDESQPEVETEKWSQGYINWAESTGITSGVTDYTVTLNYEGLCWLLVNLYESVKSPVEITAENPFSDTSSPAVIKSYQLGITETHGSDIFDGQRNVSRQVICVEIYRLMKAINGTPLPAGDENDFRDSEDIADWAKEYVNTAFNNGIITGLPDGRINPNGSASVEDAVAMLYNASLLIQK